MNPFFQYIWGRPPTHVSAPPYFPPQEIRPLAQAVAFITCYTKNRKDSRITSDSHGNSYNRGLWMSLFMTSLISLCKRWGMLGCFCFHSNAPEDCSTRPWQHRCSKSRPQRRSKRKLPSSNLSDRTKTVKTHHIFLGHLSCWYMIHVLFFGHRCLNVL